MATTFLETSDATYSVGAGSNTGFWTAVSTPPVKETDFLNKNHVSSWSFDPGISMYFANYTAFTAPAGRFSFYIYLVALPTSDAILYQLRNSSNSIIAAVKITSSGVLKLFETTNQIGSNGETLTIGKWYRISIAYNITSTSVNRFELFVNGSNRISVTNATLTNTGVTRLFIGNVSTDATLDFRCNDIYCDDSNSLKDTGDIMVTAKRPFSNGTTNDFSTQIGSGNSGYGSGHADEVNERPGSVTNGWSMIGAGAAVTEEYNIESSTSGDISLLDKPIVDYVGWVYAKSLTSETGQIIVNGISTPISLTSTNTMFTKSANSNIYPSSTGADIGIVTDTTLTTVSLYECGIMVAYKNSTNTGFITNNLKPYSFSPGNAR